jgi:murein tripeptide amidase MpaA
MDCRQHYCVYDTDGLHTFYDTSYPDPMVWSHLGFVRNLTCDSLESKSDDSNRLQLIAEYVRGDTTIRFLFNKFDIHMVPVANPDGYIHSRMNVSPQ